MNNPFKNNCYKNTKKGSIRNVFLIIFAVLLVGGAFAFAEYRNKQANNIYVAPKVVATVNDNNAELDTDNDGVKDWEEILVGTDPKDAKSKTSITTSGTVSKDLTKENKEKLSQVDLISRDFFARYMELRQLGSSADALSQKDAASKTVGNIVLPTPKSYVMSDFVTKPDSSKEAIKQYGNEISAIFAKYAIKSRNEGVITKEALETENLEILKEIDPIIASYKNIVNGLLAVQVPESLKELHLDLINATNGAVFIAQSLRKVDIDPIAGVQGVNLYLSVARQLSDAALAIKSYFSYLGITYDPTEPGYLFH